MMMLSIQIAKFKFRQYQLRATLPNNLMLAKVTHYTVYAFILFILCRGKFSRGPIYTVSQQATIIKGIVSRYKGYFSIN